MLINIIFNIHEFIELIYNKIELIPGAWWFNILNISNRNIDYSIFVNENGNIMHKYTGILNKQNTESVQSFKKITFNK